MEIEIKRNQLLKDRAKDLRSKMTKSEKVLWYEVLSRKQLLGLRFVKQRIIGNFIADFYSARLKLVIEVDGGIHENKMEYDVERDIEFKKMGISIIRIINEDVLYNLDHVRETLEALCTNSPLYTSLCSVQVKGGRVIHRMTKGDYNPQNNVRFDIV